MTKKTQQYPVEAKRKLVEHPPLPPQPDYIEVKVEKVTRTGYSYKTEEGKEAVSLQTFQGKLPEALVKLMLTKMETYNTVFRPYYAEIEQTEKPGLTYGNDEKYGIFCDSGPRTPEQQALVSYMLEGLFDGYVEALPPCTPYYITYFKPVRRPNRTIQVWKEVTEWFQTSKEADERGKYLQEVHEDYEFKDCYGKQSKYFDAALCDNRRRRHFY